MREVGERDSDLAQNPDHRRRSPLRVQLLVLAEHGEVFIDSVFAAMRAGAKGYVLKGADQHEILKVIGTVAAGKAHPGPKIARRLMNFSTPKPAAPSEAFPELTARERELLGLIARRRNNQEIARELCLNPKTVRNHISNSFTKMHVADRAQAIVRAREAGLG